MLKKDKDKFKKGKKKKIPLKKKIYLYKYKFSILLNHENTNKLKRNLLVFFIRFVGMIVFAMFILLSLRLIGYKLTWMNLISSFALLILIEELPAWIKRCKGR
jgi:predicted neutral ceramidase superfamily lipid hydrolase